MYCFFFVVSASHANQVQEYQCNSGVLRGTWRNYMKKRKRWLFSSSSFSRMWREVGIDVRRGRQRILAWDLLQWQCPCVRERWYRVGLHSKHIEPNLPPLLFAWPKTRVFVVLIRSEKSWQIYFKEISRNLMNDDIKFSPHKVFYSTFEPTVRKNVDNLLHFLFKSNFQTPVRFINNQRFQILKHESFCTLQMIQKASRRRNK